MRKLSHALLSLGEGIFSYAVDMTLWFTVYYLELSVPQSTIGQNWRAVIAADRFLRDANYAAIKNALQTARKRGWLRKTRRNANPEITAAGKRRLANIIPHYDRRRAWDGRMHVVTYDIPEKQRTDRDLLRVHLTRIGAAKLQDSVWITPYNPVDILRSYTDTHHLSGTIIVSDMGKDGSIGDVDLPSLVGSVYKLQMLNDRYASWISEHKEKRIDHWGVLQYLAILRDDPQLPFSLLSPWWKGDNAYQMVKPYLLLS